MAEETPVTSDQGGREEETTAGAEVEAVAMWSGPRPVETPPDDATKLSQKFRKSIYIYIYIYKAVL